MKERLQNIWQTAKEKVGSLSSKTKKLIIGALVLCIALSVGLAVWLNTRPYEVLFSELSSEEASEIIARLQEDGVEYKYQNDGTILVPAAQEEALKAQLVYEGYPDSGFTYDLFTENVSLTSTESEKEHYELLNLQERMGATIKLFPNIKDAKVTITLGEDSRYVLDDTNVKEASASATILTDDGDLIDSKAVRAIQRLMSKSIPGVEIENVAVICNGQDVSEEDESEAQSLANELKNSLEKKMENKVRNEINNLLLPIYGEGHFQVSVKCDIDINKKLREMINYSAENPETNTGVISNESAGWEINRDEAQVGGVPGTETNADIPIYFSMVSSVMSSALMPDSAIFATASEISRLPHLPRTAKTSALTLDLTACEAFAQECRLELHSSFGELTVLVPRSCRVETSVHTAFAACDIFGTPDPETCERIYVNGNAGFGHIAIRYI